MQFSQIQSFSLGKDTTLCLPDPLTLDATRSYATTYRWQDSSTTPQLTITRAGTYWAEVTDAQGCIKRDSIHIAMLACGDCRLLLPTAFTPNRDGRNETFRGRFTCAGLLLSRFRLTVFNRWGQTVFSTTDPQKGWDGTH